MKKVMHVVSFRSTRLVKAIKLEEQKIVAANWYATKSLPKVLQEVNVRGLMLPHDFPFARITVEFLKQKHIKVIKHLPYSPVLSMCDFWLFFHLKKNLRGRRFHSEEEISVAINACFFINSREINGLRHLICGKFVNKSALMLEETTLNTPKIFQV